METTVPSGFEIEFVKLKEGSHQFNYRIDTSFFEAFEQREVLDAQIELNVNLEKQASMLILNYSANGKIAMQCDRCLEKIYLPCETSYRLIYKYDFADYNMENANEEMVELKPHDFKINPAQSYFETLLLALPMLKNCDELESKPCNFEMLAKINSLNEESKGTNETDPRWEKLKDLLK